MSNCTVSKNTQRNGIEIKFISKPDASILAELKRQGWKWHWKNKLWYTSYSVANLKFAEEICGSGIAKMIDTDIPQEKELEAPATKMTFAQHLAAWELMKFDHWDEKRENKVDAFIGDDGQVYVRRSGFEIDYQIQQADKSKPREVWAVVGKQGKVNDWRKGKMDNIELYDFGNGIYGMPAKKEGEEWFKPAHKDGYSKDIVNGKVEKSNVAILEKHGFETKYGGTGWSRYVYFKDKNPSTKVRVTDAKLTPIEIPSKISIPKKFRKPHYKLPVVDNYKDAVKVSSNIIKREVLLGKMEYATFKSFNGMEDIWEYKNDNELVWQVPKNWEKLHFYYKNTPHHSGENLITWDSYYFRYHGRPAKAVIDLTAEGEERLTKGKQNTATTEKVVDGSKVAAKFFKTADSLKKKADKKTGELDHAQTNTPKRLREYKSKTIDRDQLAVKSQMYQAIGEAWENNNLPDVLKEISPVASKDDLYHFMRATGSNGYYDIHQTDEIYFETRSNDDESTKEKYRKQYEAIQTLLGSDFAENEAAKKEEEKLTALINDFKFSKEKGFFPTPPSLSSKMLDYADIEDGMTILEPSAGIGHIADAIKERHPNVSIDVAEWFDKGQQILKLKGYNVIGNDALSITGKYDRILMNPPYEKLQDIEHVRYAFDNNLKPGGRLVALMGESPFFNSQKKAAAWREWYGDYVEHEESLEGGFSGNDAFRKTNVRARMVVLDKPIEATVKENLQKIDEVERLRQEAELLKENEQEVTRYDEKLEAKKERYLEKAANLEKKADQHWDTSNQISERFAYGQPILVGHHSEKKARRDQQRMWSHTDKSIEARNKAGRYASKASSVGSGGINSDDPKAVRKLKEKLADRIELQESMKNMNAAFKAFKKNAASLDKNKKLSDKQKEIVRGYDDSESFSWDKGRIYPKYKLTNNNANINRLKKRIAELEDRQGDETYEMEYPQLGLKVICNVEENRIQFEFDGKPDEDIRTFLKRQMNLKWSSYHGVWQRKRIGKCSDHDVMIQRVLDFLRDYYGVEETTEDVEIESALIESEDVSEEKGYKVEVSVNPILGKKFNLRLPNKEERASQFAIFEASQLKASHNEKTFANTDGYPLNQNGYNINDRNYSSDTNAQALVETYARELAPELLITNSKTPAGTPIVNKDGIVVSGNNRTMSIKLAITDYPSRYEAYKKELREEWDVFGFEEDATIIDWYDHPVLVRIDYDIPELTTQELAKYNQPETKGKRPVDKAIELSNILMDNKGCSVSIPTILSKYERMSDFYANRSDQKKMMDMLTKCNLLTEQELAAYYDINSGFTSAGKNFLEATLSAAILDKDSIMAADKAGVKELRRTIVTTLPTLMANKGLKEGALTGCINDAVMYQLELKMSGMSFSDFIRQTSMFERKNYSPQCILINRLMNTGRNKFKKAISGYNETLIQSAGAGLFGDAPTANEAFTHHIVSVLDANEVRLVEQLKNSESQPKSSIQDTNTASETIEKDYDFRTLSDDNTNELFATLEAAGIEVDVDVEGIEMDRLPNDAMYMLFNGGIYHLQALGTDVWVEVIPDKSKPDNLEKVGVVEKYEDKSNQKIGQEVISLLEIYGKKAKISAKIKAFKIALKYAKGDKKPRLERKIKAFEIALKHAK